MEAAEVMIHVYLLREGYLHELEGTCCPCGPEIDWSEPEAVVNHKRLVEPEVMMTRSQLKEMLEGAFLAGVDYAHSLNDCAIPCMSEYVKQALEEMEDE